MKFADRSEAGHRLAGKLSHLKEAQPVVLALPRGGVAVASEIDPALDAALDIVLVCKIGAFSEPELAVGAVSDGASPDIFIGFCPRAKHSGKLFATNARHAWGNWRVLS